MTKKQAKKIMLKLLNEITKDFDVLKNSEKEAFNMAILALEQKSNKNIISRQASLNTIEEMYKICDGDLQTYHDLLIECFKVLPNI